MEMLAKGREGSCERRHPRHLAAEGHAPVRLHAFSTGLSSDFLSFSLTHARTHTQIFRHGLRSRGAQLTLSILYYSYKKRLKVSYVL